MKWQLCCQAAIAAKAGDCTRETRKTDAVRLPAGGRRAGDCTRRKDDHHMKDTIYQIFRECFPEYPMPMNKLFSCMDYDSCQILTVQKDGEISGFSAVCGDNIRLLCVRPEYRYKGLGRRLLAMSEEKIASDGYKTAVLGGFSSGLFIGAVTSEEDFLKKSNPFFEKCGYTAEDGCFEMKLAMKDFEVEKAPVNMQTGVTFGYYNDEDRTALYEAVADVDEDWVQYFPKADKVFCVFLEGKVISFTILSYDDDNILCREGAKIGSIGCVGTIHSEREKGIGLTMVALATEEMKKQNCDEVFIHWTHLDKWYGKLGYRTFLYYWFGRKEL